MSIYLDANVLVALFTDDPFSSRAQASMQAHGEMPIVSDFAAAEFASSLSRRVRTKELLIEEAREALADFDRWSVGLLSRYNVTSADVQTATAFIRRFDTPLRAPDAFHIAMALRLGAELATFDTGMARCAAALGIACATV